jgi:hypothetical protein
VRGRVITLHDSTTVCVGVDRLSQLPPKERATIEVDWFEEQRRDKVLSRIADAKAWAQEQPPVEPDAVGVIAVPLVGRECQHKQPEVAKAPRVHGACQPHSWPLVT